MPKPFGPPDARAAAASIVRRIETDAHEMFEAPMARVMLDSPWADRDRLLAGLVEFDRYRMTTIPSAAAYPESPAWVEHALAVEREVRTATNITDLQMAIMRSLGDYLSLRGFRNAGAGRPPTVERCRVVYLPRTDRGQLHIKNVDDPLTIYKPKPPVTEPPTWDGVVWDGVGNGLHMDEEPDDLFPLPIPTMCLGYCHTVPEAVEFLTRYKVFWCGQSMVLHDSDQRSVAIDKVGRKYMDVHEPDPSGGSHVSGNCCRLADSEQGRFVERMRDEYLAMVGLDRTCPDGVFWARCRRAEDMLAALMARTTGITAQEVVDLFTTPWPDGLNKTGELMHPAQTAKPEYTLRTHMTLMDAREYICWQRDTQGHWPAEPEVFRW